MKGLNKKNQNFLLAGKFVWLVLLMSLIMASDFVGAAQVDVAKAKKEREKARIIKEQLGGKYKKIKRVTLELKPDNSVKKIFITGDLTLRGQNRRAEIEEDYSTIAETFFKEEKDLLGIGEITDYLKVWKINTDYKGKIVHKTVLYRCYINGLGFDDLRIRVTFDRAGRLYSVGVDMPEIAISQELIDTLESGGWLSKEDAKEIIREDMIATTGADPKLIKVKNIKNYAITKKPYALWEARANVDKRKGRFNMDFNSKVQVYYLDAFTGQVLEKKMMPAIIQ